MVQAHLSSNKRIFLITELIISIFLIRQFVIKIIQKEFIYIFKSRGAIQWWLLNIKGYYDNYLLFFRRIILHWIKKSTKVKIYWIYPCIQQVTYVKIISLFDQFLTYLRINLNHWIDSKSLHHHFFSVRII